MFETRKAMSVIDHDAHHDREQLLDAEGQQMYSTKYSRAQKKTVLVKRKGKKTFPYVRQMLEDMVERRRSITLSASEPRTARYVNPSSTPTAEEKAVLLAEQAAHSRF
ncbi:uncharacterized protein LOC122394101 [Amphibalanus amphitrite]|uniref:uncharacterized protein LOC122394099 n=1 Tax=Amphibalanus amphitrite TaxID=1232801 RepID=UPI001C918406|nr:uncharacterized protein LOC122394099 [Amphibalanus amphitrite]XP_043246618.1 uncharacterized protein LOC122394101 [Amphibalanus amphitrite]